MQNKSRILIVVGPSGPSIRTYALYEEKKKKAFIP